MNQTPCECVMVVLRSSSSDPTLRREAVPMLGCPRCGGSGLVEVAAPPDAVQIHDAHAPLTNAEPPADRCHGHYWGPLVLPNGDRHHEPLRCVLKRHGANAHVGFDSKERGWSWALGAVGAERASHLDSRAARCARRWRESEARVEVGIDLAAGPDRTAYVGVALDGPLPPPDPRPAVEALTAAVQQEWTALGHGRVTWDLGHRRPDDDEDRDPVPIVVLILDHPDGPLSTTQDLDSLVSHGSVEAEAAIIAHEAAKRARLPADVVPGENVPGPRLGWRGLCGR